MAIKIGILGAELPEIADKCVAIAFFEDNLKLNEDIGKFDKTANNVVENAIKNKDFKAELNEVKSFYVNNKKIAYAALLGLGKEKDFNLNKLMDAVSALSKKLRGMDIRSFSIYFGSFRNKNFDFESYLKKV